MNGRRGRERRWRVALAAELDLLPLMNIFIVLIPLLLLSAVFVEVSVIRMDSSSGEAVAATDEAEPLDLAIRIAEGAYVVEGRDLGPVTIERATPDAGGEPDAEALRTLSSTLADVVATHPADPNVRIVADPTTHYEEIVAVMDVARAAGLPQAALVGAAAGGI